MRIVFIHGPVSDEATQDVAVQEEEAGGERKQTTPPDQRTCERMDMDGVYRASGSPRLRGVAVNV